MSMFMLSNLLQAYSYLQVNTARLKSGKSLKSLKSVRSIKSIKTSNRMAIRRAIKVRDMGEMKKPRSGARLFLKK